MFVAIRVATIAFTRINTNSEEKSFFQLLTKTVTGIKLVLETRTAYGVISIAIILIFTIAGIKTIKEKKYPIGNIAFVIYLMITMLGMLIFNGISGLQLAPRYDIPVCYLLGELLLIALKDCKKTISTICLLILGGGGIPVLCFSDVCAQHLAYANIFDEQIILLNHIIEEREKNPDLQVIVAGSDEITERFFGGEELRSSIKIFFGALGKEWYDIPSCEISSIDQYMNRNQDKEALWLTTYTISNAEELLSNNKIFQVCHAYPQVKILSDMYHTSLKIDQKMKLPSNVAYDVGACMLRNEPYWNLYSVLPAEENSNSREEKHINISGFEFENYTNNKRIKINSDEPIVIPKGECAKIWVELEGQTTDAVNYLLEGEINLQSGNILYGYADKNGNMYTAQDLKGEGLKKLKDSYMSQHINAIELFIFIPAQDVDTIFTIEEISLTYISIKQEKLEHNIIPYGSFW